MNGFTLKKENLPEWLAKLGGYDIYLPQEKDGLFECRLLEHTEDLEGLVQALSNYGNSIVLPKKFLFPNTETMFNFKTSPKIETFKTEKKDNKTLLFGIRPCDAKSFNMLDAIFYDEPKDCKYLARRENTTIIVLACKSPHYNCFCTSMGIGPASKEGADLLLIDLGDRYFVDVVTEKGNKIIEKGQELFSKATDEDEALRERSKVEMEEAVTKKLDINGLHNKLGEIFESAFWEKVSQSCIGCGICTYLCPTCYCFDITDETKGNRGRRMRTWDTCMFPGYTVHASGHNPRPEKSYRTRNRILHKFRYYVDKYNITACVGCGRCINHCPVNIDIVELLEGTKEVND